MARRGDNRSPSPVGTSSSSRYRSGHDRSRDARDRNYRRRSRSPDRAVSRRGPRDEYRERDRDRDRNRDQRRRDDDHYRHDRDRDRSRDRYRSPEPSHRDKRRDSRERYSVKHQDGARHGERQHPATEKESLKNDSQPQLSAEEKKQAERLARMEKWKQRQAEQRGVQKPDSSGANTPQSASTSAPPRNKDAIGHVPGVSQSAQGNGITTIGPGQNKPDNTRAGAKPEKGAVGKFGLSQKQDAGPSKTGMVFEEEEVFKRKLERLPSPLPEDQADAPLAQDEDEDGADDELGGMDENATEEDAAAAAQAALQRREARLAEEQQSRADAEGDVKMADANAPEDDDELDPLDAYMLDLQTTQTSKKAARNQTSAGKTQEPEAMYSDNDEMTAVGDNEENILEMTKARKKKDIPLVDHEKMEYEPFQKAFYHEPSELAGMSEEEVAALRFELDGIKVRGTDVPKPVVKWSHMGLGLHSLNAISRLGFDSPTAIQAQAIPAIMSGRDVLGIAKTGSGKTLAFLLPMFRHIKAQKPLEKMDGPIGMIMAPTRELASQIHRECRPWLKALDLRAVCCYGGAPIKDQINELKFGAEIVVCTPGRMIDILASNNGRVTNLRRTTYVVLDEADRMFDMGFEPQVMRILRNVRPTRQTLLFSATFPRNIEGLARKILESPIQIVVGGQGVVAQEIAQLVEVREEKTKFVRLLQLLGEVHDDEDARSLVFVDRQEAAEELMNAVLKKGYPCFTIHGGKDQFDRDSVISDFKAGVFPVLIATSVAARGLDVKQLRMVVNYDAPNHLEDYVHRAGRTGRAGQKGLAVTFITPEQDKYALPITKALKASGQEVPDDLQALADGFGEKVKLGKEKISGSGFGGKGLARLEAERETARNRERKAFKTGDEPEDEEAKEAKDEKVEKFMEKALGKSTPVEENVKPPQLRGLPEGISLDEGQIKVTKTEREPEQDRSQPKDKAARAADAIAAINARLRKSGDIRGNAPIDNKGPDAGAFHATLEINDFPQKARWAVTNRTNVAKILESTGTSITTKGNFYAQGKMPAANEPPKLYILVEGDTELVVTNAMKELYRLLKDATAAALDSEARAPTSGRYSVI